MRFFSRFITVVFLCVVCAAAPRQTRNIILITADGLRWQDLFGGMDPMLKDQKSAGMDGAPGMNAKLWRDSAEERRNALMPFFWGTLAPKGVVLGNVNKGSSVRVTNSFRVSYPGYSEILTGRAQDQAIRGNDAVRNPTTTVLEFLRHTLKLDQSQVALFASWDMFSLIGEHTPGSIVINAGYRAYEGPSPTERMRQLSALQFELLTPWTEARHDYITFEMALDYLKTLRPRVLYMAFDESDDWAHERHYNRVLDVIGYYDTCLRRLYDTINSLPEYRDHTTLILTCDHGRGATLEDWHSHGEKVPAASQIWIAVIGPDTPAIGEATNATAAFQRDIAPTILELTGIGYREYEGVEGQPIAMALGAAAKE